MDIAEQNFFYLSECETFPSKLKLLSSGKVITRISWIAKYSPFIGPAGILRSTGCIGCLVNTDFDSKHPILFDARQAAVRFLIRHLHVKNFYQGLDYMRAAVTSKYCVTCQKRKAQIETPIMSDLSIKRLRYKQPPFSSTDEDYFEPFLVPIRRSTEKIWGFLLNCLTT